MVAALALDGRRGRMREVVGVAALRRRVVHVRARPNLVEGNGRAGN